MLFRSVCYFVVEPNDARLRYNRIVDEVNRRIHAALGREGIAFAYPTRTLLVRNTLN